MKRRAQGTQGACVRRRLSTALLKLAMPVRGGVGHLARGLGPTPVGRESVERPMRWDEQRSSAANGACGSADFAGGVAQLRAYRSLAMLLGSPEHRKRRADSRR